MTLSHSQTWCETCYAQTHDAQACRITLSGEQWTCPHGETAPVGATTKPPIPQDWTNNPHQF
jgi:hypothetical protein